MGALDSVDLTQELGKKEYRRRLGAAQRRLLTLRLVCGGLVSPADLAEAARQEGAADADEAERAASADHVDRRTPRARAAARAVGADRLGPPLLVVAEGWDAGGKGGAIERLVEPLDPRHVRVVQYAAPTPDELRHHWLARFWPALPGWGGMTVMDRSWYGRVLVERVEGFATADAWRRAYDETRAFEQMLVDDGTVLVKLWLHVSDAEQLRRFESRRDRPLKRWKLTDEDWRNRGRRADYEAAVDEMVARTSADDAPWTVVPGDDKRLARVVVCETVVAALEDGMRRAGLDVPPHV